MPITRLLLLFFVCTFAGSVAAQALEPSSDPYTRRNTFLVFGEYANDSSHIILGQAENRGLTGIGVGYERRLSVRRHYTVAYSAEFRPVIISSDPAERTVLTYTDSLGDPPLISAPTTTMVARCYYGTYTYSGPVYGPFNPIAGGVQTPIGTFTDTAVTTCTRVTTLAQGLSPIGFLVHLRPQRRLQVLLSARAGYMFSAKPIPIQQAGSFNFTFAFSAGFEYFRHDRRSMRLEYILQHYSNAYTAAENPGVDAGFVRLSYAFGR